ncbi:J domain-containing protein [Sphingomonas jatrophae]|uniref:DnaJ domain-containing protein n=1 Tax=Sphingomonas jatrophae TaxID=1166337 RepID=A0A1I6L6P6_9SPHN|nr:J domain-containing protein [Sphingomonas jatrophae]SFR99094.1 DnaJ domain-containing protein [Sphingomonas jatrophae]
MRTSYYDVLGVAPSADEDAIKARYLLLIRRYHPDRNSSPLAHARTAEINAAFRCLSDPAARSLHDADLAEQRRAAVSARALSLSRGGSTALVVRRRRRSPFRRYAARFAVLALLLGTAVAGWQIQQRMLSGGGAVTHVASEDDGDSEARVTVAELNAATAREARAMPPVSRAVVADGAGSFHRLVADGQAAQARAFSERCHRTAADAGTWNALDFCVAFDQAAFVGRQAAEAAANAGYFVDRHDRAAHLYVSRLSSMDTIALRLDQIRSQIRPPKPERSPTERLLHGLAKRGWKLADAVGDALSPGKLAETGSAGKAGDF